MIMSTCEQLPPVKGGTEDPAMFCHLSHAYVWKIETNPVPSGALVYNQGLDFLF